MRLKILHDTIESCNINFLLGSGLSRPYLITLGNIESLLERLDAMESIGETESKIIRASLYSVYFKEVMIKNLDSYTKVGDDEKNFDSVISNYASFLQAVNTILIYRYSPILSKQINLFTTNIDLFFERALEMTQLEFNDGFKGRLKPAFNLSNFQKSYRKTSLHYKNTSEIPVFNLIKLHGSINWEKKSEEIVLSNYEVFEAVSKALDLISKDELIAIKFDDSFDKTLESAKEMVGEHSNPDELIKRLDAFLGAYSKLQIVNPSKEKFKTTLLNTYYYELLRLFANEMEKENTVLFGMGFSFADEHIREITTRALNSNPTLQLYVFAFDKDSKASISKAFGVESNKILNGNLSIIAPEDFCEANKEDESVKTFSQFDFGNINEYVFNNIATNVNPWTKAI